MTECPAQSIYLYCEQLPKARLWEGVAGEEDVTSMEGDAGGVEEVNTRCQIFGTNAELNLLIVDIFSALYLQGSLCSLYI